MVKENLEAIRKTIPAGVLLVAVSKTKPVEDIQEAYDAGQRVFGENHAIEMRDKHEVLPKDIDWHLTNMRFCQKTSTGISSVICRQTR